MEGWLVTSKNRWGALANYEHFGYKLVRDELLSYDLQILFRQSFGSVKSWNLYQQKTINDFNPVYSIRYACWQKDRDIEIVSNIMEQLKFIGKKLTPTIIRREVDHTDNEKMYSLVQHFNRIKIPQYFDDSIKLDGNICEVALNHSPNKPGLRYSWWGNAPEEWSELAESVTEAIAIFTEQSQKYGWIDIAGK